MLRPDLRPELSPGPAVASAAAAPPALQRATGRLELAVGLRAGTTRLVLHRESGSTKARFPRPAARGPLECVLLNTAGGLAGGDQLEQRILVEDGAALLAVGQAAEKVYRSTGPDALLRTRLEVRAGGTLLWLPQETILFDGARLDRRLEVDAAADARLVLVEAVVLGRTERGERVREGRLVDRRLLRREGTLLLTDPFRLEGPIAALADRPALLGGAKAFATLLALGPGVDVALLEAVRARLVDAPARAAAGLRGPVLLARLLAADGFALRRALLPALELLLARFGVAAGVPRVWRC
ncbi:MAG: urease accessory protein UreD [Geminicoccaceae bacterium]|nr:urease accessory protein UreD [Geminicoccaceae bacterium]MCX8100305.1 urease accessory protein UreD [Geminicoccaceae bacterium]